jgi:hypothetical protein
MLHIGLLINLSRRMFIGILSQIFKKAKGARQKVKVVVLPLAF